MSVRPIDTLLPFGPRRGGLPLAVPRRGTAKVGVNAAVNADAHGTPPGAPVRRLVIGQEVVHNEHITTDAKGQTQILFLDGSSVSVGPNADLIIDEFVYDPATGTGRMTLTAVQGAMRFVGGKLSKQDNAVTLRLGTATIGVRGGVFVANVQRGGAAEIIFVYGKAVDIAGQSGCAQTLYRPGYEVTIGGPGACPDTPPPRRAGRGGSHHGAARRPRRLSGGAKTVPTNATVASSGISPIPSRTTSRLASSKQPPARNHHPAGADADSEPAASHPEPQHYNSPRGRHRQCYAPRRLSLHPPERRRPHAAYAPTVDKRLVRRRWRAQDGLTRHQHRLHLPSRWL